MAPSARIRVIGEGFTTVQCQAVARIAARHLFLRSLVDAQHDVDGRVAIGVRADLPARFVSFAGGGVKLLLAAHQNAVIVGPTDIRLSEPRRALGNGAVANRFDAAQPQPLIAESRAERISAPCGKCARTCSECFANSVWFGRYGTVTERSRGRSCGRHPHRFLPVLNSYRLCVSPITSTGRLPSIRASDLRTTAVRISSQPKAASLSRSEERRVGKECRSR